VGAYGGLLLAKQRTHGLNRGQITQLTYRLTGRIVTGTSPISGEANCRKAA